MPPSLQDLLKDSSTVQDGAFCRNFARDSGKSDADLHENFTTVWYSSGLWNPDLDKEHIRTLFQLT